MYRLDGKVVLVTGAAQGVGRATAELAARAGARVVLVDRNLENCDHALDSISALGGTAIALEADLHDHEGNAMVVREVMSRFGRINGAVFNVGGAIRPRPYWEYSPAELEAEITHSLWPTLWGCREVIPVMLDQKQGVIVNVGSAAVRWLWRGPYSAAKAGIHALTHTLAGELKDSGVRVVCVAPGALSIDDRLTPRAPSASSESDKIWRAAAVRQSVESTPMGRTGMAEEVASVIGFAISDAASYLSGSTIFVAGGETG